MSLGGAHKARGSEARQATVLTAAWVQPYRTTREQRDSRAPRHVKRMSPSQRMAYQRSVCEPTGSGKRGAKRDAARDCDERLLCSVRRSFRRFSALCRPSCTDDQRR